MIPSLRRATEKPWDVSLDGEGHSFAAGVTVVSSQGCKPQSEGMEEEIYPLICFVGDYGLTLLDPEVRNVHSRAPSDAADIPTTDFSKQLDDFLMRMESILNDTNIGNSSGSWLSDRDRLPDLGYHTAIVAFAGSVDVTVAGGNIRENTAGPSVVAMNHARVSVVDSVFANSTALAGAGIWVLDNAPVSVKSSYFEGLSVSSNGASMLACNSSQLHVHNTSFLRNKAVYGAGVYAQHNSRIGVANSTFTTSTASSAAGVGVDSGAQAVLDGCLFEGNDADTGTGVNMEGSAHVNIINCRFVNNTARSGAGRHVIGFVNATATACVFTNNTARENGAAIEAHEYTEVRVLDSDFILNQADYGTILIDEQSAALIRGSTFRGNVALYGGGVFCNARASVAVYSSLFEGNIATSQAGALAANGFTQVTVVDVSLVRNKANDGGAILALEHSIMEIRDSSFSSNTAQYGAGLIAYNESTVVVTASAFTNNSAVYDGGGIMAWGSAKVSVLHSVFEANTADSGGGINAIEYVNLTVTASQILNNQAGNGAGIQAQDNTTLLLQTSLFDSNTVTGNGGGVLMDFKAKAALVNCSFNNNQASDGYGAAVVAGRQAALDIRSCSMHNNAADRGGAMWMQGQANLSATNNSAARFGGAINIALNTTVMISGSVFSHNKASTGGALYVWEAGSLAVESSLFEHNDAQYAGAVYAAEQSVSAFSNTTLQDNSATHMGGALYAAGESQVLLSNCTISKNIAFEENGGGIAALDNATVTATRGSIALNLGDIGGGVYASGGAKCVLKGVLVQGNAASTYGGGIAADQWSQVDVSGVLAENNTTGENGHGGGIFTLNFAQLKIEPSSTWIVSNQATEFGGSVAALSMNFNPVAVLSVSHNNTARFDKDVTIQTTHMTLISDAVVRDFLSSSGTSESILTVRLNIYGFFGLPCEGMAVTATSDTGQPLGASTSDAQGVATILLRMRKPPGQYTIRFLMQEMPDIPPVNMTLHVRHCVKGEVSPSPDTCQLCLTGFYRLGPKEAVCNSCPADATCPGGAAIVPLPGNWHSSADSAQIHRCPNPQACQGDRIELQVCSNDAVCRNSPVYADLQCSKGYYGNVCGMCDAGAGLAKTFNCRQCLSPSLIIAFYVMGGLTMLGFIKLLCHFTLADNLQNPLQESQAALPTSDLLHCLVLYSQWMLVIASLNVEWPATIAYPMRFAAAIWSTSNGETSSVECLLSRDGAIPVAGRRLAFYLSMPLAMLLLLLMIEVVVVCFRRSTSSTAAVSLGDRLASNAMVVTFFFLPAVLRITFGLFACIILDKPVQPPYIANAVGSFWVYDLAMTCFTGYHNKLALGLGLPLVLVLCIGMPAVIVYVTLSNRKRLQHRVFVRHYGFLTRPYVTGRCWWEAVVVLETSILVAISIFGVNIGPFYQAVLMVAALALIIKFLTTFKPHAHQEVQHAMSQAAQCLFLTSLIGLSFLHYGTIQPSATYDIIAGLFILLINLAFVFSILWRLVKSVELQLVIRVVTKLMRIVAVWSQEVPGWPKRRTTDHPDKNTAAC